MSRAAFLTSALLFWIFFPGCKQPQKEVVDFPRILQSDTLRVITLNTSISYFIYRDQPMGYHYDMVSDFCRHHGIIPKVMVAQNISSMLEMLQNGTGDVIAYDIPISNSLKESFRYCGPSRVAHQVLVQRSTRRDTLVTDVTQLIGKRVTLIEGSRYLHRMKNLNSELGGGILIDTLPADTLVAEDLIRKVSRGEIAFTVVEDDVAQLNKTYFKNLDVRLPVSFEQRSSWVVRKDMSILGDSLERWYRRREAEPTFQMIIKRYFEASKGYLEEGRPSVGEFLAPGVISPFDAYFKQYGKSGGIDWRLLASISYQESRFKIDKSSWAGAVGLMGLMPATAAAYGVSSEQRYDPEASIRAGTQLLKKLMTIFGNIDDPMERLKISLAAYNAGSGHLFDARALAKKYGADNNVWSGNVEHYLQLKRLEQYYTDPVCKNGYFRADETIRYVRDVMARWNIYKENVKE